jgi:hypothetical protein
MAVATTFVQGAPIVVLRSQYFGRSALLAVLGSRCSLGGGWGRVFCREA